MPPEKMEQVWQETLEPELIGHFTLAKRKYLGGFGEIVDGQKVQGKCNSSFGWRPHQNVVSEYGVALIISKHSIPFYILGISIKDFPSHKPLTLYRLTLQSDKQFGYKTLNFGSFNVLENKWYDSDWDELLEVIEGEFKELGKTVETLKISQSSNIDSCASTATMVFLMLSAIIYTTIKLIS